MKSQGSVQSSDKARCTRKSSDVLKGIGAGRHKVYFQHNKISLVKKKVGDGKAKTEDWEHIGRQSMGCRKSQKAPRMELICYRGQGAGITQRKQHARAPGTIIACIYDFFSRRKEATFCVNFDTRLLSTLSLWGIITQKSVSFSFHFLLIFIPMANAGSFINVFITCGQ